MKGRKTPLEINGRLEECASFFFLMHVSCLRGWVFEIFLSEIESGIFQSKWLGFGCGLGTSPPVCYYSDGALLALSAKLGVLCGSGSWTLGSLSTASVSALLTASLLIGPCVSPLLLL